MAKRSTKDGIVAVCLTQKEYTRLVLKIVSIECHETALPASSSKLSDAGIRLLAERGGEGGIRHTSAQHDDVIFRSNLIHDG